MNSLDARKLLDRMTGPLDPHRPPNMADLLEWTERVGAHSPPAELAGCLFGLTIIDDDMASVGFHIVFPDQFNSASRDSLVLFLDKRNLAEDDPMIVRRRGYLGVSSRDYPTLAEFFAAVRADEVFRFACTYPFEEVDIRHDPRAGSTKKPHDGGHEPEGE